jgi:hypothetical protein
MRKYIIWHIILLLMTLNVAAQSFSVSSNKRYILREGKPFFWMDDTAWELFHRLDRDEADYYLSKRASQGFTLIQAVALAEMDVSNVLSIIQIAQLMWGYFTNFNSFEVLKYLLNKIKPENL